MPAPHLKTRWDCTAGWFNNIIALQNKLHRTKICWVSFGCDCWQALLSSPPQYWSCGLLLIQQAWESRTWPVSLTAENNINFSYLPPHFEECQYWLQHEFLISTLLISITNELVATMPVHSMFCCARVWMLCAPLACHRAFTSHPNGFGGNDAHKRRCSWK